MNYFNGDIEKLAKENSFFRKVIRTGKFSQIVIMSLQPGEDIGSEVHHDIDQIIKIEQGDGKTVVDGKETEIHAGHLIFVPSGVEHNFVNTGNTPMKLYSIYSPPEHPDGTIHQTKAEAGE